MTVPAIGGTAAYFELIQSGKDKVIGVVAEPAGQGLRAALVMVMLRSVLHVLGRTDKDMAALLNWANRVLSGNIEAHDAPSVGLVCLNLKTRELEFANAGTPGLIVCRHGSRNFDALSKASMPLGKGKRAEYERIRLQLHPGDTLVLYTGGVTGCIDGQGNRFGRQALAGIIAGLDDADATVVMEGIRGALSAFGGTTLQKSSQAVLVMKVE
jgi:sigma-B regulation protein RsbU (phosphoserine phosphatase)